MRLLEGQTKFDVIYGTIPASFTPPAARNLSVGVQKNNTAGNFTLVGCDTTGGGAPPVSAGTNLPLHARVRLRDTNPDANAGRWDGDTYANPNTHPDPNGYSHTYRNSDGNTEPNCIPHVYSNPYPDTCAHTDSNTNTNTNTNTNSDTHTDSGIAALNLSTRMQVQTGDNVGIGGFIITGNAPKHILLRAIGPSLAPGVPDPLADTVLELHGPGAFVTILNDNWRDDPAQEAAIIATGIPPTNNLESAIDTTVNPGAYTAIISGKNNTSGVALVEVYDLSQAVPAKLANISTRAFVSTGDNIVIAGFLLGGHSGSDRIAVRGLGPSLTGQGVPNALADPTLELRNSNGVLMASNNDWQNGPPIPPDLQPSNPLSLS